MSKKQLIVATLTLTMAVLLAACSDSEAVVESGLAQDAGTTSESSETTETTTVADDSDALELTPDNRVREDTAAEVIETLSRFTVHAKLV